MRYKVEFYEESTGRLPVEEFLQAQTLKMRAKIYRTIELLELEGPALGEPYSKSLGNGVFEIRVRVGSDAVRILYFFVRDRRIILTNGFAKKSQKAPLLELERAKRYRDEFLRREGA